MTVNITYRTSEEQAATWVSEIRSNVANFRKKISIG